MKYLFFILPLLICCQQKKPTINNEGKTINIQEKKVFHKGHVFADNQFDGARLNDFKQINDSTYRAVISPENIPVNNSPWFAFRLWSKKTTDINLELKYTEHRHRYIPKMSRDGMTWKPMSENDFQIDSTNQMAILRLQLTPDTLWLAAQEVISSNYTNRWIDSLSKLPFAEKNEIGKTVMGQPIFSLEFNDGQGKNIVILIGRQHPPEVPGGTFSFEAFLETLLSDKVIAQKFRQHFDIIAIPMLNPDGADMGHWRHNANGIDLNRDWQLFSQPETQVAKNYLQKINESKNNYCFGIDFHTSYSGPYLLTLDSLNEINSPGIIPTWIQKIEQAIPDYKLDKRLRSQELPYCYNWLINEFGMEAVTFEEGDEVDREEIKERAIVYAEKLMETLMEFYP